MRTGKVASAMILATAIGTIVALAACSNEITESENINQTTLTATAAGNNDASGRTDYEYSNGTLSVTWNENDQLWAYANDRNCKLDITNGSGKKTAKFCSNVAAENETNIDLNSE